MTRRANRAVKTLLKTPSRLYDAHAGWLLGRRFLRLTHRGRSSGRVYRTVLEVVGEIAATGEVVVVAGLGPGSDWYRNIQACPALAVEIGRERWAPVCQRGLGSEEAAAVLADYERRNRAAAPVLRLVLSRLLGWSYDGSDQARTRLTRQLPFTAFRPATPEANEDAATSGASAAEGLRLKFREIGDEAHLVEL